jgi:hypothetical protein
MVTVKKRVVPREKKISNSLPEVKVTKPRAPPPPKQKKILITPPEGFDPFKSEIIVNGQPIKTVQVADIQVPLTIKEKNERKRKHRNTYMAKPETQEMIRKRRADPEVKKKKKEYAAQEHIRQRKRDMAARNRKIARYLKQEYPDLREQIARMIQDDEAAAEANKV